MDAKAHVRASVKEHTHKNHTQHLAHIALLRSSDDEESRLGLAFFLIPSSEIIASFICKKALCNNFRVCIFAISVNNPAFQNACVFDDAINLCIYICMHNACTHM